MVSKGAFAALIGVSRSRVSQMISEGKIGADALVGEGRQAKIRVVLACQQIGRRTDIGQRLGNGIGTDLNLGGLIAAAGHPLGPSDQAAEAIKRERLLSLKLVVAREEERRLAERGRYVRADHAFAAMAAMSESMLAAFDMAIVDLAGSLASEHSLVPHDTLREMLAGFQPIREKAATSAQRFIADLGG